MSVELFKLAQETVEVVMPIVVQLEQIIIVALSNDGENEVMLLGFQMTVMTIKFQLSEFQQGLNDQGENWMTDEHVQGFDDTLGTLKGLVDEVQEANIPSIGSQIVEMSDIDA